MRRNRLKAMLANLVGEPWCLTPDEIGRLTDRQILELYYHRRDPKTGAVEEEPYRPAEGTLEHELSALAILAGELKLSPAEHQALREQVQTRWRELHPTSPT